MKTITKIIINYYLLKKLPNSSFLILLLKNK